MSPDVVPPGAPRVEAFDRCLPGDEELACLSINGANSQAIEDARHRCDRPVATSHVQSKAITLPVVAYFGYAPSRTSRGHAAAKSDSASDH
jgi:hypothetical protein